MFLMQPCPTITDNVNFLSIGDLKSIIPRLNQTRALIKKFSNTQKLIQLVQGGEIVMQHKIKFDQYLKSQVDLMKTFVGSNTVCQFKYNAFLGAKNIDTTLMTIKQQWGMEIIMSRYILSSVYIGGSLHSIGKLFEETTKSYEPGYTSTGDFTKQLQVLFKYFTESVDPLRRLYQVIDSVAKLFTANAISQYPQASADVFKFFTQLVMCNLAYIKLQKLRMLQQYKSCKQGAWSVYQKMKQLKLKLTRLNQNYQIPTAIGNFINLGIVFYKSYALNFMLHQNQENKVQKQYGFIKKQFQLMILENVVIADEILKLQNIAKKLPGQEEDNVIFANMILEVMGKHAQSIKYKFQFDIHENKLQRPSIQQVVAHIEYKNIWNTLGEF